MRRGPRRRDAAALLGAVAGDPRCSAYARASALAELGLVPFARQHRPGARGLSDPDPLVRIGALDMLEGVPPDQLWRLISPLLSDPSRGVRIRAAALLAPVPDCKPACHRRERPSSVAAAELIAAQRLNADRPEARSTLGNFYARRGLTTDAETEYKAALRLSPQYAPAAVNLADLYGRLEKNSEGESVMRAAVALTEMMQVFITPLDWFWCD